MFWSGFFGMLGGRQVSAVQPGQAHLSWEMRNKTHPGEWSQKFSIEWLLKEFPGGLSTNYHFCILGLSTWSQHSRSQRRRTSCSRDEDRKPSEVFLEFDLHFVTSLKIPVHTIYPYVFSGNGSIFFDLLFFYFLDFFSLYILAGTYLPSLTPSSPLPLPLKIREFSCWHSYCQHQFLSVNLVVVWHPFSIAAESFLCYFRHQGLFAAWFVNSGNIH